MEGLGRVECFVGLMPLCSVEREMEGVFINWPVGPSLLFPLFPKTSSLRDCLGD